MAVLGGAQMPKRPKWFLLFPKYFTSPPNPTQTHNSMRAQKWFKFCKFTLEYWIQSFYCNGSIMCLPWKKKRKMDQLFRVGLFVSRKFLLKTHFPYCVLFCVFNSDCLVFFSETSLFKVCDKSYSQCDAWFSQMKDN